MRSGLFFTKAISTLTNELERGREEEEEKEKKTDGRTCCGEGSK